MILILKPRSWNTNGNIDIVTATVEYDFHYRRKYEMKIVASVNIFSRSVYKEERYHNKGGERERDVAFFLVFVFEAKLPGY